MYARYETIYEQNHHDSSCADGMDRSMGWRRDSDCRSKRQRRNGCGIEGCCRADLYADGDACQRILSDEG